MLPKEKAAPESGLQDKICTGIFTTETTYSASLGRLRVARLRRRFDLDPDLAAVLAVLVYGEARHD